MGKSNRIRANRANAPVHAPRGNKKNKKGLSSRAMSVIALIVTVAILLTVVAFVLIGKGVPNRLRTSAESENFSVNTNMMSYYFYSVYNDFVTNYEDYMDYFSLDTSKSLKEQKFGGDGTQTYYDASFLGSFDGTWFDYFAEQTKNEVTSMLLYLEEANARGMSLTDEEKDEITASLESTVSMYGYSSAPDTYFSLQYGKGVAQKDVQKAIEYSTLASKVQNVIYEEFETWLKENPDEIDKKYNADKKAFDVVDFTYYSFRVNYDDIAKETLGTNYKDLMKDNEENQKKVMDAYKKAIDEAKEKANALIAITDEKELKSAILDIVLGEAYDSSYETQLDKVAAADLLALLNLGAAYDSAFTAENAAAAKGELTDTDLTTIKNGMIKELVYNALANDTEENTNSISIGSDKATAYGKTIPTAFAEILNKIRTALETTVEENISTFRAQMIKETIEKALADKKAETDSEKKDSIVITEETKKNDKGEDEKVKTATAYGKDVPVSFAEALIAIRDSLDTKATSALSSYVQENGNYTKDDKFSEWAFADGRASGDTNVIVEGDGEKETLTSDTGYTYVTAYVLKNAPHKNEEKTRDVAYAIFQTETNAKNAAEALSKKEGLDAAAFEEIVKANSSAGNTTLENYREGQMGNTVFDGWLYDEELPVGAYTKEPLKLAESTWAVAFYTADGEPNWKMSVQDTILSEKLEAQYEEMEAKYGGDKIETHDSAINKIKA